MLDLEVVVWIILPLALSVVLLLTSINALRHDYRIVQFQLGIPTLLLVTLVIVTLVRMLQPNTWPTILPHMALVIALPLVLLQRWLAKSHCQRTKSA